MKDLSSEQIKDIIESSYKKQCENILERLVENIDFYNNGMKEIENKELEQYALYIATMSTAQQVCVDVITDVLCNLLADKQD